MKKLSLLIIPIALFIIGVFAFANTNEVKAANGDRASYKLQPWTFWQTGVTTDDWNRWELSAFSRVYIPDDSDKYSDSTAGSAFNPREYTDKNFFKHSPAGTHAKDKPCEVTLHGVSHGFIADIDSNGWSGKWTEDETERSYILSNLMVFIVSEFIKSLSTLPGPTDANWSTSPTNTNFVLIELPISGEFTGYIDEGAYMAKYEEGDQPVDEKYVKIVGTTVSGKLLFVKYLVLTTTPKTYQFNFDLDQDNSSVKVEMMFGAFLKYGPNSTIKHQEVVWHGTVHVEDCDIIQGNMTIPPTTTTKKSSGGGDWGWDDEEEAPAKVTGLKAKKAKKSVKLSWKKQSSANKYQINYSLKKNFKGGKKKNTTKNKYTVKGLKSKKTYYFRVRGVNDYGNGAWSAKKKCKTK